MLGAVAFVHLLNDLIQSVLPAVYPTLKDEFGLNFTQICLITLTFKGAESLLQPWVGMYTDRHPKPYLLPIGMCFTLVGIGMNRHDLDCAKLSNATVGRHDRRGFVYVSSGIWRRAGATVWRRRSSRWVATRKTRSTP